MAQNKIVCAAEQRPFIMIYQDFLDSDVLTPSEQMVFIHLKSFANLQNQCFPSYKTLAKKTGYSTRKVQDIIKSLEIKGVIRIDRRIKADGGKNSNFYTLYDFKEKWQQSITQNDNSTLGKGEEEMVRFLQERGYIVTKAKEPESIPTKAIDTSSQLNQFDMYNNSSNEEESQQKCVKYPVMEVRELIDYSAIVNDYPEMKQTVDAVVEIIYNTLNTNKQTIYISGGEKSASAVKSKLLKLGYEEIIYCIDKFDSQKGKIKNVQAYMLTLLYNAKAQMRLDIQNQINYDSNR